MVLRKFQTLPKEDAELMLILIEWDIEYKGNWSTLWDNVILCYNHCFCFRFLCNYLCCCCRYLCYRCLYCCLYLCFCLFFVAVAFNIDVAVSVSVAVDVSVAIFYLYCWNVFVKILSAVINVNIIVSVNGTIMNIIKYCIVLVYVFIEFCGSGGGGWYIWLTMLILPLLITFTLTLFKSFFKLGMVK